MRWIPRSRDFERWCMGAVDLYAPWELLETVLEVLSGDGHESNEAANETKFHRFGVHADADEVVVRGECSRPSALVLDVIEEGVHGSHSGADLGRPSQCRVGDQHQPAQRFTHLALGMERAKSLQPLGQTAEQRLRVVDDAGRVDGGLPRARRFAHGAVPVGGAATGSTDLPRGLFAGTRAVGHNPILRRKRRVSLPSSR